MTESKGQKRAKRTKIVCAQKRYEFLDMMYEDTRKDREQRQARLEERER